MVKFVLTPEQQNTATSETNRLFNRYFKRAPSAQELTDYSSKYNPDVGYSSIEPLIQQDAAGASVTANRLAQQANPQSKFYQSDPVAQQANPNVAAPPGGIFSGQDALAPKDMGKKWNPATGQYEGPDAPPPQTTTTDTPTTTAQPDTPTSATDPNAPAGTPTPVAPVVPGASPYQTTDTYEAAVKQAVDRAVLVRPGVPRSQIEQEVRQALGAAPGAPSPTSGQGQGDTSQGGAGTKDGGAGGGTTTVSPDGTIIKKDGGDTASGIPTTTDGLNTLGKQLMEQLFPTKANDTQAVLQEALTTAVNAIKNIPTEQSSQVSLMKAYDDLRVKQGIPQLETQMLDMKRIMGGTRDDMRLEIARTGGVVTESQLEQMVTIRNNELLKTYTATQDALALKNAYVDQAMTFTEKDRTYHDQQIQNQVNLAATVADISTKMDTSNFNKTMAFLNYMQQQKDTATANVNSLVGSGGIEFVPDSQLAILAGRSGYSFADLQGMKKAVSLNNDTKRQSILDKMALAQEKQAFYEQFNTQKFNEQQALANQKFQEQQTMAMLKLQEQQGEFLGKLATQTPKGANITVNLPGVGGAPTPADVTGTKPTKVTGVKISGKAAGALSAQGTMMSQDDLNFWAHEYLKTKQIPPFGLSGSGPGAINRAAFFHTVAQVAKEAGMSGEAVAAEQAAYKGDQTALATIDKLYRSAQSFEKKAIGQISIVSNLSKEVPRTQFPIINDLLIKGQTKVLGDKNASLLLNSLVTFSTEYAKIMSGSTGSVSGVTESARKDAAGLINVAMNNDTLQAQLDLMKREMDLTIQGFTETIQSTKDSLATSGGSPETGNTQAGQKTNIQNTQKFVPLANAGSARIGSLIQGDDGQVYRKLGPNQYEPY